jgi:hypothetical protein
MRLSHMNTSSAKAFLFLAWYGVIAPLVAGAIIVLILLPGAPKLTQGSPAQTASNYAACFLLSAPLASVLSIFGGSTIGWGAVIAKALIGILLSVCGAYVLFLIAMSMGRC